MATPRDAVAEFLGSAPFTHALTVSSIGTAVLAQSIQRLVGWAGLIAIVAALVILAVGSILARRRSMDWQGLLPISLLVFLGWSASSIFWSQYQWPTLGALAYFAAFTVLGIYIALIRDTIQIVRAYGDVLRFVLGASLVLEIFAGVLIDGPIRFLGIDGSLATLGPIQGLMQTRNQLGLIAVIGVITFGTEFRTRSVPRSLSVGSLVVAGLAILLARSPIIAGTVVVVGIAAVALYGLRRVRAERRTFWQLALLAAVIVAGFASYFARGRLVEVFNASGALDYRLGLWRQVWGLITLHPLEGWGWIGRWQPEVTPFPALLAGDGRTSGSALNAYLDTWFQLGLVGAALFVGLVGLAFVRSWLLAGRRRSILFAWPALVLVALITVSFFESSILVEYGWLTFVVCCVKAARELSWRGAFATPLTPDIEVRK